jgi:hypothetical protein
MYLDMGGAGFLLISAFLIWAFLGYPPWDK